MGLFKEKCGHPTEWNLRVKYNTDIYTYCIGCIVEKCGLDNLEVYDNPFIKKLGVSETKVKFKTKEKTKEKLD